MSRAELVSPRGGEAAWLGVFGSRTSAMPPRLDTVVVRRGMDAYVIIGDPDPDKTGFTNRLALKLIWTF